MPPTADLTRRAHAWLAPALAPGAVAVDATCGNGHDTLFLARAVAPGGVVHAFDLQALAIERARARLAAAPTGSTVHWHEADHAGLARRIGPVAIDAAAFNLGWLPRSDSPLVTRPESTIAALDAALRRLRPGGRLAVVCYRGHAGGAAEADAVAEWAGRVRADQVAREPPDPGATRPRLHVLAARR